MKPLRNHPQALENFSPRLWRKTTVYWSPSLLIYTFPTPPYFILSAKNSRRSSNSWVYGHTSTSFLRVTRPKLYAICFKNSSPVASTSISITLLGSGIYCSLFICLSYLTYLVRRLTTRLLSDVPSFSTSASSSPQRSAGSLKLLTTLFLLLDKSGAPHPKKGRTIHHSHASSFGIEYTNKELNKVL